MADPNFNFITPQPAPVAPVIPGLESLQMLSTPPQGYSYPGGGQMGAGLAAAGFPVAGGVPGAGGGGGAPTTTGNGSWLFGQKGVSGDGVAGWLGNSQNLAAVVEGIGALSTAYLGFQQLKLAKEAIGLQKEAYRTNMRNSTQTYNTSLEDRIRGRTSNYDGKEADVQSYLSANSLRAK